MASFYFLAAEIFKDHRKIRKYFLAYSAGMTPVVIYFLVRMFQSGIFNQAAAYSAPNPFFLDHTAIGAGLAFLIPLVIYFLFGKGTSPGLRLLLAIQLILFISAFILSYSRAAWISLVMAGLATLVLLSGISWKIIVSGIVIIIVVIATSWTEIVIKLNENRQESSADMGRHIQSIANIRSDASNMERINRWKAALRMSAERPLLGWGPGTYQFNYAPFQVSTEKTIISTNYGEGGNAHSEYLGALSESGIPGLLFYIFILFLVMRGGIRIWKYHPDRSTRLLTLALMAGLVTYIIHGGLNNFLDSDKISALFWGMVAAIVALDENKEIQGSEELLPQVGSDN
jgi:O-antigen ligase